MTKSQRYDIVLNAARLEANKHFIINSQSNFNMQLKVIVNTLKAIPAILEPRHDWRLPIR